MNLWIGLPSWGISAVFVSVAAYVIHQPLRAHRPALDAAGYVFTWIFVTTLYVLLPGLAGLLRPVPLAGIAVAGLAVLAAVPASRNLMLSLPSEMGRAADRFRAWWSDLPTWLRWFTAGLMLFSVIRFAFLVVVLPPFVWDSLTYHLTNVAHWTQAGRIELFDAPVVRIYTPANFETLATWFTVFLHHDVVVEAAGLPAYLLALLATYALARELGFSRTAGTLASLTYGSTPALLLATTGTKNDPHMAAYFITCLAIIAHLVSAGEDHSHKETLGQLVLLGVIVPFAFGTKAYMLHLIPGLLIFGLVGGWWYGGTTRQWAGRIQGAWDQFTESGRGIQILLLGIVIAALFLGTYWNIRNWVLTGNPFYPYGVAVGGSEVLPSGDRTARLSLDRLTANIQSLVGKFGDRKGAIRPDLPGTTGWGWFVYVLGVPTFLWGLVRKSRLRWLALSFGVALLFIFLSDRPSPYNMRYIIWFPALFSLAFAGWVDSVLGGERWIVGTTMGFMVVAVLLNYAMMLNYNAIRPEQFQQMLERSVWDRQAATLKVNMPAEYENALVYVPKDALLGYNVSSNGFIYPLYRADFSQRIVYVPFSASDTCEDVVRDMQSRHTHYLFVAPEHSADANIALLRRCSETPSSGLRQRARGLYVIKNEP